jgi:hypothetical protein
MRDNLSHGATDRLAATASIFQVYREFMDLRTGPFLETLKARNGE